MTLLSGIFLVKIPKAFSSLTYKCILIQYWLYSTSLPKTKPSESVFSFPDSALYPENLSSKMGLFVEDVTMLYFVLKLTCTVGLLTYK